jgi:hypothetical protein
MIYGIALDGPNGIYASQGKVNRKLVRDVKALIREHHEK